MGARSSAERGLLAELLAVLPLVIAVLAVAEGFELLHVDRHFVLLSELVPLRQRWALEEIAPPPRTPPA